MDEKNHQYQECFNPRRLFMNNTIIRKTQYSIRFTVSSMLILLATTELSMARNIPQLELSIPVIAPHFLENDFDRNTNNHTNDQLLSLKTFRALQPLQKPNKNILSRFQDRYLTYHYGKNERIKAMYDQGAYCITYQQEW